MRRRKFSYRRAGCACWFSQLNENFLGVFSDWECRSWIAHLVTFSNEKDWRKWKILVVVVVAMMFSRNLVSLQDDDDHNDEDDHNDDDDHHNGQEGLYCLQSIVFLSLHHMSPRKPTSRNNKLDDTPTKMALAKHTLMIPACCTTLTGRSSGSNSNGAIW